MTKQKMNIWELMNGFRKSLYFSHVLNQQYRIFHANMYLPHVASIRNDTQFIKNFKLLLEDSTMLKPKTIVPIIESNPVEQIRNAVTSSLDDEMDPEEVYNDLYGLSGAGSFFASTLLSIAMNGDCIIYEKTLLEGLKEITPEISEGMNKVDDAETYFDFMNMCRTMKESFGFTSYAELHEFLWHGHDTKWAFKRESS